MSFLTPKDKAELEKRAQKNREVRAEEVRQHIQSTLLVKSLQDFALGKSRTKYTPARLKAIEMLLERSVPTLASIKHEVEAKTAVFNMTTAYTPKRGE